MSERQHLSSYDLRLLAALLDKLNAAIPTDAGWAVKGRGEDGASLWAERSDGSAVGACIVFTAVGYAVEWFA